MHLHDNSSCHLWVLFNIVTMLQLPELPPASNFISKVSMAAGVLKESNSKLEFSAESDALLKCNPSHLDSQLCHPG